MQDPIKIRAAAGAAVHVHRDGVSQNLMEVDYARYLTIEGIEWSGGDVGIRISNAAYFFFHNNEVHDTGDAAINANSGDTQHLYFVGNHIHHTRGHGEGFYLGANNAAAITHHTYVIGNWVHDTGIEASSVRQGDGIEIKIGSYACIVSDNLVEDTNYPGILLYGNGGRPERNVIERNIILRSREGGIQIAADAIVRNNLIIDCNDSCIVSQSHQGANPQNLDILHNTLINSGNCLAVSSWTGPGIVFANNAIYSASSSPYRGSTTDGTRVGNILLANLSGLLDVTLDGTRYDATPLAGSPLRGAANATYVVIDDLSGEEREGAIEVGCVDVAD